MKAHDLSTDEFRHCFVIIYKTFSEICDLVFQVQNITTSHEEKCRINGALQVFGETLFKRLGGIEGMESFIKDGGRLEQLKTVFEIHLIVSATRYVVKVKPHVSM